MLEMESRKRRTLVTSLLRVQSARVLDDLAEMLIKRLSAVSAGAVSTLLPSASALRRVIGRVIPFSQGQSAVSSLPARPKVPHRDREETNLRR
jgi:hypothetical protein